MEKNYYPVAAAGFIVLTIVCLAFILLGTYKTLLRMGMNAEAARKRTLLVAAALIGWAAIASVLALTGILSDFDSLPPKFFIVIIIPFVAIVVLMTQSGFKRFLAHVPDAWLLHIQVFRVPVELLLWLLFLDNLVPVQMTFEGRNFDVLTGLTAPIAAYVCFGQERRRRNLAIGWNLLGLALLLNIVAIAMLSTPTPLRAFMNEPANTIVAQFPFVFLPAILVPIAYSMHFFSLKKLAIREATTQPIITKAFGRVIKE